MFKLICSWFFASSVSRAEPVSSIFPTLNSTSRAISEIVAAAPDIQEDVQPGEVHSSKWLPADSRSYLSKADTVSALRTLDYKANPDAAIPYFTNGLGLERFYEQWVKPSVKKSETSV